VDLVARYLERLADPFRDDQPAAADHEAQE
jgi:hypothetical protein